MHSTPVPTKGTAKVTATPDPCAQYATTAASTQNSGPITVKIDPSCALTSQFATGMTQSDTSLGDPSSADSLAAVNNINALIKNTITYQDTPIMGWGLPDPWPDPSSSGPTDWSGLDKNLQETLSTGAIPVITLSEAPWWMKGVLEGKNKTQVLTAADEWTTQAYEARILDNKMPEWLQLVRSIAERYMVAPYNVRYFQVWNELKGYYDPTINNYDFTTSAGNPSGPNAEHGYTYMYNQVYATLMQVATSLHIPTQAIKVGGPYVFMDTWSSIQQSDPSDVVKAYGVFDQRPLDVLQYWLQHKVGAGFITIDGSVENRDTNKVKPDPFTAAQIYGDIVKWIRSLNNTQYPGATTLPIWLAEWFASPRVGTPNADYDNAVKAYAMINFIQAGGASALSWNNYGDGWTDEGLWVNPSYANGGEPLPWYSTFKAFHDDFAAGTKIYTTTVSNSAEVAALASPRKIMLVNKTATTLSVTVNAVAVPLSPYQVSIINNTGK